MNDNNSKEYIQDFNTVFNIYANSYSHEELLNWLKNGSIAEKQASALELKSINSQPEAEIFISNLIGCDGKIREAVSFRLKEFVEQNPEFFVGFSDIFLDAIIDINGNICRNTIFALGFLKNKQEFCKDFIPKLLERTNLLLEKVKTFGVQDGKYKVNKEFFKLYWYLETIYLFCELIEQERLVKILALAKNVPEYTIREKTAKILSKLYGVEIFDSMKAELKNDENYYVKRY